MGDWILEIFAAQILFAHKIPTAKIRQADVVFATCTEETSARSVKTKSKNREQPLKMGKPGGGYPFPYSKSTMYIVTAPEKMKSPI